MAVGASAWTSSGAAILAFSLWLAPCRAQDRGASRLAEHVEVSVPPGDIRAALAAFDQYSYKHRLGMHLGSEKGLLIESAVRQGLPASAPGTVLETGCHAGDGTLRAIAAMSARPGGTIVSTEGNAKWLAAAERVVGHATRGADINFVPLSLAEDAPFDAFLDRLRKEKSIAHFDTVIFDQDQSRFLSQLKDLLAKGFLRPGATLYVDNAKTKAGKLRKYLDFVDTMSGNGFETKLTDISQPYADAVAISTFVGVGREL